MDKRRSKLKPRIEEKGKEIQEGGPRVVSPLTHSLPPKIALCFPLSLLFFSTKEKITLSYFKQTRLINSPRETSSFSSLFHTAKFASLNSNSFFPPFLKLGTSLFFFPNLENKTIIHSFFPTSEGQPFNPCLR